MKTPKLIFTILIALAAISLLDSAFAEGFPDKTGYLIDSRGNVVRNSFGECWRTGYWTPAMAIEECDPDLVKKPKAAEAEPVRAAPPPPPPASVAAPEKPVVAAAAPSNPVVAAYFSAETLFDFDRSVVRPEGRRALDEQIVANMKMHPEVTLLIITGHADRIGADEYNQGLSERRANAVKAYLVKQGIPAGRMTAVGKGESEPNPAANTRQVCKGKRGDRLIACLQPDRRVTVVSQRSGPDKK